MSDKSASKNTINKTATFRTKQGVKTEFSVCEQAGQKIYYDSKGKRIGYIDAQGRTLSADNQTLNNEPRPDLILREQKHA
jgi:hypothetical protein